MRPKAAEAPIGRSGSFIASVRPSAGFSAMSPISRALRRRKGIKSVAIPIPGTNKKIDCVISLLQLGGGCGITDPNLNEQPTDGRPPPDVPFKPELQEDNGSVRP